jgi:hypothetical protein
VDPPAQRQSRPPTPTADAGSEDLLVTEKEPLPAPYDPRVVNQAKRAPGRTSAAYSNCPAPFPNSVPPMPFWMLNEYCTTNVPSDS